MFKKTNLGDFNDFLSYFYLTCLVTLFDQKLQFFEKLVKLTIYESYLT